MYESSEVKDRPESDGNVDEYFERVLEQWRIPEAAPDINVDRSDVVKPNIFSQGSSRITRVANPPRNYVGLIKILAPSNVSLQEKIREVLEQPGRLECITLVESAAGGLVAALKQVAQSFYVVSSNGKGPEYKHIHQGLDPKLFYEEFVKSHS